MPDPQQEMLDFARGLSAQGVEDLHLRLLSRQANAKKELLQVVDELVEISAQAQIVALVRAARETLPMQRAKPGLISASPARKRRSA